MISKQEQRAEIDYLKSVLYVLNKEIEKKELVKDQIEGDIKVAMKYIWGIVFHYVLIYLYVSVINNVI
jgi:hypothetical protein